MKRNTRQKLGQHFLTDGEAIERIIAAGEIAKTSNILEIGPGKGALTEKLRDIGASLSLIEADTALAERLGKTFPNANIINKKAEHVDFSLLPSPLLVISNLPYYASVHIFKHCTKNKSVITNMVLMFQQEVASRISAEPGKKSYGSLSLYSQYNWKIETVLTIPPEAFTPQPKVYSSVLKLRPRLKAIVEADEKELFKLIRSAFTQKRRTLRNNLKNLYSIGSIDRAFEKCMLDAKVRAETVSLKTFAEILPELEIPAD